MRPPLKPTRTRPWPPGSARPASTKSPWRERPTFGELDAEPGLTPTKAHRVYRLDTRTSSICADRLDDASLPHLARAIALWPSMRAIDETGSAAHPGWPSTLRPDRAEATLKILKDTVAYDIPGGHLGRTRAPLHSDCRASPDPRRGAGAIPHGGAREPSRPTDDRVTLLCGDCPESHGLAGFPPEYTPESFQDDCDLAQEQALLYDAVTLALEATPDFKPIVRCARLSRLLHRIAGHGFARSTAWPSRTRFAAPPHPRTRDGVCQVSDRPRAGTEPATAHLQALAGRWAQVTHRVSALFDSGLEELCSRKFGEHRSGWKLLREGVVPDVGEHLPAPDFFPTHRETRRWPFKSSGAASRRGIFDAGPCGEAPPHRGGEKQVGSRSGPPEPERSPRNRPPLPDRDSGSCPHWKSSEVRPVGAAPKAQAPVSQTSECHPGNRSRKSRRAPARRAGPRTHRTP